MTLPKIDPIRLDSNFFSNDVLFVAPNLLGKTLVRRFNDGTIKQYTITETEAYKGVDDLACHASKGRTPRTDVMFQKGGLVYVYLIYGMYWMLNFVTSNENEPQAVLIRGIEGFDGPGKLTKELQLDKSFYAEDLSTSNRLWVCEGISKVSHITLPRVGIEYAGDYWKNIPWRFKIKM
jgi:DNA-3-methyladenine glycosylase